MSEKAELQRFTEEVICPERWKRLEEIYYAALPMDQGERRAFLNKACAGDEELCREADSLLAADDAADDFLQSSAFTLGMKVLAEEATRRGEMSSEATQVNALPVGTVLDGRYKILRLLAVGGMTEVYEAEDTNLSRRRAVKVLKKESLENSWVVKKFRQGGQALTRVDHANVEQIFHFGTLPNGEQYLVVEYVKGVPLRWMLRDRREDDRQMAFSEAAEIMKQVGRGVGAIHQAGYVHRDLKPENVMAHREEGTGDFEVKVIDLGIVLVLNTNTEPDQITGTLLYASPEQLKLNSQEVTFRSDVYALGELAYEMLTGRPPFNPEDVAHLLELKKTEVKIRPRALRPGLPGEAESLILKALSVDASKRPESAREFGDELSRVLTLPPRPTLKRFGRRRTAAAAVVLVAVIAVIFAVLWWGLSGRALQPEIVAMGRPQGSGAAAPGAGQIYITDDFQFPTGKPPEGMVYATIGFTVWRTRPATPRDGADAARETIDSQEMASERVADDITDGERIYLGIESLTSDFLPDRGGYLYVINREQYADGTFGRARLIFPTQLTHGGNNRVKPGQPIVLPEKNRPFIVKRSGATQSAETYTIILSPWEFQLPESLSNKAMVLPDNLVADWEKRYGGRMYHASLRGGLGRLRTKREQAVSTRETIDTAEALTQDEPLPQTTYRRAVKIGNPAIVTIALRFKE